MHAARAAKKTLDIIAIGFTRGQADKKSAKEALSKAGADRVIEKTGGNPPSDRLINTNA